MVDFDTGFKISAVPFRSQDYLQVSILYRYYKSGNKSYNKDDYKELQGIVEN